MVSQQSAVSTAEHVRATVNDTDREQDRGQHAEHATQQPAQQGAGQHVEHLILTTIVKEAQWNAGTLTVLEAAHATLRERAGQRGLILHGQPHEHIEVIPNGQRVRITLTADAVPAGR